MSKIVVAYDFSKHAEVAMAQAVDLACHDPEATLHFVTALDKSRTHLDADDVQRDLRTRVRGMLDARKPFVPVDVFVYARIGDPVREILGLAEEIGADLIVLGSHGYGAMGRLLIGSVSEAVLHGARCPVLIVRQKTYAYVALDKLRAVP